MNGQASAEEVTLVILFFLTCGILISLFTDAMLRAIEQKRARLLNGEDPWKGYLHRGTGFRRR